MREILFRGKRINNGEWVYGDIIHRRYLKKDVVVIRTEDSGFDNYSDYEVDPSTVGECVSDLTDRNCKKIFEGDIVKIISILVDYERVTAVIYGSGLLGVKNEDRSNPSIIPLRAWDNSQIEVIGNVYDNPELLEGKP